MGWGRPLRPPSQWKAQGWIQAVKAKAGDACQEPVSRRPLLWTSTRLMPVTRESHAATIPARLCLVQQLRYYAQPRLNHYKPEFAWTLDSLDSDLRIRRAFAESMRHAHRNMARFASPPCPAHGEPRRRRRRRRATVASGSGLSCQDDSPEERPLSPKQPTLL